MRLHCIRRTALSAVIAIGASFAVLGPTAAHAEKVLHYGNDGDLETFDPQINSTIYEDRVVGDLCVGLTTEAANGEIIPGAAESWSVSGDGLVYTFKLREHSWSDGNPVTADDWVFSFRRMVMPETAAKYASLLFVIENAEDINGGKKKPEELGVRAIDSHTLEVTLKAPTAYYIPMLAHHASWAVPKHVVEKHGKDWAKPENFVCNGAYTIAEYVPNSHVTLTKNDKFYDAHNVKIDKIIYHIIEDRSEMAKRFRAGELHITGEIPSEQVDLLRKEVPDAVYIKPWFGVWYYAFNTRKEPFNDVRVRKALSMAINREVIADQVLKTGEVPAYSWVPPGVAGYGDPVEVDWKALSYEQRVAEAKKLMADAGYGPDNPLKFQLRYNTNDNIKRISVAVAAMWKQHLGVEAELFNTDVTTHYADIRTGKFDVARAGWIGDYEDAQNLLFLMEDRTGPSFNYAGYNNPEYNELMIKAGETVDQKERVALMRKAEAIAMADQPNAPVYFYVVKRLVSPKITGFLANARDVHRVRWMDIQE